ncbi:MAG: S41 family peptidase [Eubacteriales bacterium]
MKKHSTFTLVCSLILAVFITFEVTYIFVDNARRKETYEIAEKYQSELDELKAEYSDNYVMVDEKSRELFEKLAELDAYYRAQYVGEIDEEKLAYYVMNGYIYGAGDKYGSYYTADELSAIVQDMSGDTVGIGVYVAYDSINGTMEVLSVMPDSPALEAGIKAGDIITAVEGKSISELGYYGALDKIKGDIGTTVKITVIRGGDETEYTLVRKKITTQPVTYHKYALDPTIGIIRITEFNDAVPSQFKSAVESLLAGGAESLVFDMRYNPGGTLSSVVKVLDYLLPEGVIATIEDSAGTVVDKFESDSNSIDVPMAVLVNGSTASAAELFTCALKDYGKAVVVGEKTYGKGTMQMITMLSDGSGLRISTNMYNPPKSENYEGKGITPDVIVELDESLKDKNFYKITDEEDNQLLYACRELGYEG